VIKAIVFRHRLSVGKRAKELIRLPALNPAGLSTLLQKKKAFLGTSR